MYEVLIAHLRECAKLDTSNNTYTEAANAIEKMSEAYDKLSRHMDDLAALMPRWIPVSERLPKYGERVLVFGGVTMYVAYYDKNRYGGESWHKLNSKSHYCNPTYWMPLPQPPKEE